MEYERLKSFIMNCDFDELLLIDEFLNTIHRILQERMSSEDV